MTTQSIFRNIFRSKIRDKRPKNNQPVAEIAPVKEEVSEEVAPKVEVKTKKKVKKKSA